MTGFVIDGLRWDVRCKIVRTAEVRASDISGPMLDGSYLNDVLGTYMSYAVSIAVPQSRTADYYAIYEALTDPVGWHTFVLPYNAGTLTITAYVTSVTDTLYLDNGNHYWAGTEFTVVAAAPTKELSLDEVITRGAAPLPEGAAVSIGSVWAYGSDGWETVPSADDYTW